MNYIFGKSCHISIQFNLYFLDLKVMFISWLNNFDFNFVFQKMIKWNKQTNKQTNNRYSSLKYNNENKK